MIRPAQISRSVAAAVLFVLSLVAGVLASCAGIGDACQFDSDCGGGNLCIEQTCYAACSDEQDCESPYERCMVHTRAVAGGEETVKACVGEDFDTSNNGNEDCEGSGDCCTSDAECVEHFGDESAVCGIDKRCIIPVAPPKHGVLIRDRSDVDASAAPDDGGLGADIVAAFVRVPGADEPIGFGVTLEYQPANGADGRADIFDGTPPDLDEDGQCIAGSFDDGALPLGGEGAGGEEGYLLLGFVDANGERLELNMNWELVVAEWGANCGAAADEDTYDVYFCSADSSSSDEAADLDAQVHCTRRINTQPASGYHVWSLSNGL